jgi:hypothetical protein
VLALNEKQSTVFAKSNIDSAVGRGPALNGGGVTADPEPLGHHQLEVVPGDLAKGLGAARIQPCEGIAPARMTESRDQCPKSKRCRHDELQNRRQRVRVLLYDHLPQVAARFRHKRSLSEVVEEREGNSARHTR